MPKPIDAVKAGQQRLTGKVASDVFKKGNNAGMLFKKEAKASTNIHEYRTALQNLRMKESQSNEFRKFS
jgi:hypothetical protein